MKALDDESFDVALRMEHVDTYNFILSKHGHFDRLERQPKWIFSKSEVKDIKAELSEHEAEIALAPSADTMTSFLLSLFYQNEVRDIAAEILLHPQETRRITTRIERNSEKTRILKFVLEHNP